MTRYTKKIIAVGEAWFAVLMFTLFCTVALLALGEWMQ